jgi:hypothetical protein
MDTKALEDHLEQHRAPYQCTSCGTAYTEEVQLLQHYKESPNEIHPLCEKCGIAFENSDVYTAVSACSRLRFSIDIADQRAWGSQHVEETHPRFACDTCDGALFDQDELPAHYLSSRKHPKCEKCHIGFNDQFDFADVSAKPFNHFLPLTITPCSTGLPHIPNPIATSANGNLTPLIFYAIILDTSPVILDA